MQFGGYDVYANAICQWGALTISNWSSKRVCCVFYEKTTSNIDVGVLYMYVEQKLSAAFLNFLHFLRFLHFSHGFVADHLVGVNNHQYLSLIAH